MRRWARWLAPTVVGAAALILTLTAGTATATSILRVRIHEHRSCDRGQSITFWAAATVEKQSFEEQFTYETSQEGM